MGLLKRVVIVHGGAWKIPKELQKPSRKGVKESARLAMKCLMNNGSALDAVELAVRYLEDNPHFDAGTGSVLNAEGEVELDAAIMEGKTLNAGAIAAVRNIKNPISLARSVMENSNYVLLVGRGANKFATHQGYEIFTSLKVRRETERWKRLHKEYKETMKFSEIGGTVGAVAIDATGNIAAATSTGGVPFKPPGRVGDSCLIGSGLYADNEVGGVSATGDGESIMKIALSKVVCEYLGKGWNVEKAAQESVKLLENRIDGRGGVIVIDKGGDIGLSYNTPKMACAYMKEGMDKPESQV